MTTVKTTAELHAALAAGADPQTIQIAVAEQVDTAAIKTAAAAEAVTAERARIKGINELSAKGFEKEIEAAIDSGSSVEATALTLFKAAQDRGISLAGIKADGQRAATSTPAVESDADAAAQKTAVSAIVAGANRR